MKAHFLTFGGGSAWPHAARRLASQAQATGLFETVSVETGNEIFERWPEFAEHRPFVEANPRGWGYWLWKPFLLRSYLRRIQDGELLFYLDAGFEILVENKDRLQRLLQQSALNGALLFGCPQYPILNAIFWAKQDLLDRFAQNYGLKNLEKIPLVAAGSLALVKNKQNLALLDDWYRIGASEGGHLIDDSPSVATQKQLFIEHRHDQAIFDFLIVAHGIPATGSFLYYDSLGPAGYDCSDSHCSVSSAVSAPTSMGRNRDALLGAIWSGWQAAVAHAFAHEPVPPPE
jgi:hypothetical protein